MLKFILCNSIYRHLNEKSRLGGIIIAFTLRINAKGLFRNQTVDLQELLNRCQLHCGNLNEFYILRDHESGEKTAVLFNPKRLARGIFFDAGEMAQGKLTVGCNLPTTESEIRDFLNVIIEIVRQLKKCEIHCAEEDREYTIPELLAKKEQLVDFSLNALREFCSGRAGHACIFTLVRWPLVLSDQLADSFSTCHDLHLFEEYLHEQQKIDVYYAKPSLIQNKATGKMNAFYTLTEECDSIFPLRADGFLNFNHLEIEKGFIRFYLDSEDRIMDGMYPYVQFIRQIMTMGATYYDEEHVRIPSLSKGKIEELARSMSKINF